MESILTSIKQDYIMLENMMYDYNTLIKLDNNLNKDSSKEQILFATKTNTDICNRNDISTKNMISTTFSSMESLDFSSRVVLEIAKENLNFSITNLIEKIKNFIISSYNKIKLFIVKITTMYPLVENNNRKLIEKISKLKDIKPFTINNRRDLKWVVNKAPILMSITKDIHKLNIFIKDKNHIQILDNFMSELRILHKALLESPDINSVGFIDKANKAINYVLHHNNQTVYDELKTILPELSSEKSKYNIYRVDGSTCKYRTYVEGNNEYGVKTIKFSNRTASVPSHVEDKIIITNIFSPDEVIRIINENISYISNIRQLCNSVNNIVKECDNLIKQLDNITSIGIKSGSYRSLLNTYMKMNAFIVSSLSVETILSNYSTSQNIYYAFNKYIDLGFKTDNKVSTEAQLPNLPEGVVNGNNPEFVRALDLNDDNTTRDNITINISSEYSYNKAYQIGDKTYTIKDLDIIIEDLLKDTFISKLKETKGNNILNLFNENELCGIVNIKNGFENTILDIKSKVESNMVDVDEYIVKDMVKDYNRDMILDYIDLDLSININNKLYGYLIDYLDKVVLEINALKYKIEATRQIKCNTIVS